MGRMVRSRKEYICVKCATTHLRWVGFCKNCKAQGTLEEKVLLPTKPKATLSQRSLGERAKRSERSVAKEMQEADGPAEDAVFRGIKSSTGRIGHITSLQIDAVSRSYVTENKNRVMPSWLIKAWIIINQRAIEFNKEAFLHIEPPNMPKTILINGKNVPLSTMAIITQARHKTLARRDRALSEIESLLLYETNMSATMIVAEVRKLLKEL